MDSKTVKLNFLTLGDLENEPISKKKWSVPLRTCLWNGFKNCPEAPQNCLHHLTHPIQLVRSLVETLRPEVGQKAEAAFKAIAGK